MSQAPGFGCLITPSLREMFLLAYHTTYTKISKGIPLHLHGEKTAKLKPGTKINSKCCIGSFHPNAADWSSSLLTNRTSGETGQYGVSEKLSGTCDLFKTFITLKGQSRVSFSFLKWFL